MRVRTASRSYMVGPAVAGGRVNSRKPPVPTPKSLAGERLPRIESKLPPARNLLREACDFADPIMLLPSAVIYSRADHCPLHWRPLTQPLLRSFINVTNHDS